MPIAVNDAIASLTTIVMKHIHCPPGSQVGEVRIMIITRLVHWNKVLAVEGSAATYHWRWRSQMAGSERQIMATNWVMLDPTITTKEEANPPVGPIVDEGLLYHELLHGQLVINAMDTPGWQATVCDGVDFDLGPADGNHIVITPAEHSYLDARAAGTADVYVVDANPQRAGPDGEFSIPLGTTEKTQLDYNWEEPDGDGNIVPGTFTVYVNGDGALFAHGWLTEEGKKEGARLYVQIDPPGQWIVGGIESPLVVLPPIAVGGVAERRRSRYRRWGWLIRPAAHRLRRTRPPRGLSQVVHSAGGKWLVREEALAGGLGSCCKAEVRGCTPDTNRP